jgi:hypothetical protein
MKRVVLLSLMLLVLATPACVISEQEGERTHVNSPHPEEISFHFDSSFNSNMIYLRTAALLALGFWVFSTRTKGANPWIPVAIAVAMAIGAAVWLKIDWDKVNSYRIDVMTDRLVVEVPSQPRLEAPWQEVMAISVEGMSYQVGFSVDQEFWSNSYEDLTIELADGSAYYIDLRPLSYEQRGTFWRAIKRKAELTEGGTYISER